MKFARAHRASAILRRITLHDGSTAAILAIFVTRKLVSIKTLKHIFFLEIDRATSRRQASGVQASTSLTSTSGRQPHWKTPDPPRSVATSRCTLCPGGLYEVGKFRRLPASYLGVFVVLGSSLYAVIDILLE